MYLLRYDLMPRGGGCIYAYSNDKYYNNTYLYSTFLWTNSKCCVMCYSYIQNTSYVNNYICILYTNNIQWKKYNIFVVFFSHYSDASIYTDIFLSHLPVILKRSLQNLIQTKMFISSYLALCVFPRVKHRLSSGKIVFTHKTAIFTILSCTV